MISLLSPTNPRLNPKRGPWWHVDFCGLLLVRLGRKANVSFMAGPLRALLTSLASYMADVSPFLGDFKVAGDTFVCRCTVSPSGELISSYMSTRVTLCEVSAVVGDAAGRGIVGDDSTTRRSCFKLGCISFERWH